MTFAGTQKRSGSKEVGAPSFDEELASHIKRTARAQTLDRFRVVAWQVLILIVVLAAWEILTRIPGSLRTRFLTRFSSVAPLLLR